MKIFSPTTRRDAIQPGTWLMDAAENVAIDKGIQLFDLVKQMNSH